MLDLVFSRFRNPVSRLVVSTHNGIMPLFAEMFSRLYFSRAPSVSKSPLNPDPSTASAIHGWHGRSGTRRVYRTFMQSCIATFARRSCATYKAHDSCHKLLLRLTGEFMLERSLFSRVILVSASCRYPFSALVAGLAIRHDTRQFIGMTPANPHFPSALNLGPAYAGCLATDKGKVHILGWKM